MGSSDGSSPKRGAVESDLVVKNNLVGAISRSDGAIDVDGRARKIQSNKSACHGRVMVGTSQPWRAV